jgi:hypothetical protein
MAELVDAASFKLEVLSGACGFESHCGHHGFSLPRMKSMTTAREQMTNMKNKLALIRADIARLKAQEEVLVELIGEEGGELPPAARRKRSPNIKPLVLDLMHKAGFTGATSAEVDQAVRYRVPTVAKDTVGSVLSRLKSDGALSFDGERYYEKKFAPQPGATFRVVS